MRAEHRCVARPPLGAQATITLAYRLAADMTFLARCDHSGEAEPLPNPHRVSPEFGNYRTSSDTYTKCALAPVIVKGSAFDTVAALTFITPTLAVLAMAISAAGISTVSCVA